MIRLANGRKIVYLIGLIVSDFVFGRSKISKKFIVFVNLNIRW